MAGCELLSCAGEPLPGPVTHPYKVHNRRSTPQDLLELSSRQASDCHISSMSSSSSSTTITKSRALTMLSKQLHTLPNCVVAIVQYILQLWRLQSSVLIVHSGALQQFCVCAQQAIQQHWPCSCGGCSRR